MNIFPSWPFESFVVKRRISAFGVPEHCKMQSAKFKMQSWRKKRPFDFPQGPGDGFPLSREWQGRWRAGDIGSFPYYIKSSLFPSCPFACFVAKNIFIKSFKASFIPCRCLEYEHGCKRNGKAAAVGNELKKRAEIKRRESDQLSAVSDLFSAIRLKKKDNQFAGLSRGFSDIAVSFCRLYFKFCTFELCNLKFAFCTIKYFVFSSPIVSMAGVV